MNKSQVKLDKLIHKFFTQQDDFRGTFKEFLEKHFNARVTIKDLKDAIRLKISLEAFKYLEQKFQGELDETLIFSAICTSNLSMLKYINPKIEWTPNRLHVEAAIFNEKKDCKILRYVVETKKIQPNNKHLDFAIKSPGSIEQVKYLTEEHKLRVEARHLSKSVFLGDKNIETTKYLMEEKKLRPTTEHVESIIKKQDSHKTLQYLLENYPKLLDEEHIKYFQRQNLISQDTTKKSYKASKHNGYNSYTYKYLLEYVDKNYSSPATLLAFIQQHDSSQDIIQQKLSRMAL